MSFGTKHRQQEAADLCKQHLRENHKEKLSLVNEFIAEFEGTGKNQDIVRWSLFTDARQSDTECWDGWMSTLRSGSIPVNFLGFVMRKRINPATSQRDNREPEWLDLESLAEVEVTSENPAYPIEFALIPGNGGGWKASEPGRQTIRLLFDSPQRVKVIHVTFIEDHQSRTQEFALRWSDAQHSVKQIVRQQFNFSPGSREVEDYTVDLEDVSVLELEIDPAKGLKDICASLSELRLR